MSDKILTNNKSKIIKVMKNIKFSDIGNSANHKQCCHLDTLNWNCFTT